MVYMDQISACLTFFIAILTWCLLWSSLHVLTSSKKIDLSLRNHAIAFLSVIQFEKWCIRQVVASQLPYTEIFKVTTSFFNSRSFRERVSLNEKGFDNNVVALLKSLGHWSIFFLSGMHWHAVPLNLKVSSSTHYCILSALPTGKSSVSRWRLVMSLAFSDFGMKAKTALLLLIHLINLKPPAAQSSFKSISFNCMGFCFHSFQ